MALGHHVSPALGPSLGCSVPGWTERGRDLPFSGLLGTARHPVTLRGTTDRAGVWPLRSLTLRTQSLASDLCPVLPVECYVPLWAPRLLLTMTITSTNNATATQYPHSIPDTPGG